MFRHQGKNRTSKHNLRLATLLSFVAGIVNVTGVLAVKTLTTNVTGHFAFFAEEVTKHNYQAAIVFLIYTLFFLAGAFTSNFLAELVSTKKQELSHLPAIAIEFLILVTLGTVRYAFLIYNHVGWKMDCLWSSFCNGNPKCISDQNFAINSKNNPLNRTLYRFRN